MINKTAFVSFGASGGSAQPSTIHPLFGEHPLRTERPRPVSPHSHGRTLCLDVTGHLDLCGPDLVEGWIYWGSELKEKLQLEIFIDAVLIGRCEADMFRPDLEKAGCGDGRCAFSFRIPRPAAVRDFSTTRARVAGSTLYLLPEETTVVARAAQPADSDVLRNIRARRISAVGSD